MKRIILLLCFLMLITGCSVRSIQNDNIDTIVESVLTKKISLSNSYFDGYKYYLPRGLRLVGKKGYNAKIVSGKTNYYLFVDAVSYYYKKEIKCNFDDNVYYKEEFTKDKKGCLQITEQNNDYLIRFFYNYARIEALVSKNDLNSAVLDASYILSTVKFNDTIIESILKESDLTDTEKVYEAFTSNSEIDNFYRTSEENMKVGE